MGGGTSDQPDGRNDGGLDGRVKLFSVKNKTKTKNKKLSDIRTTLVLVCV